jgi:hypothetical protein
MKTAVLAFLCFCFYLFGGQATAMDKADSPAAFQAAHIGQMENFQIDPLQRYISKASCDFSGDDELIASVEDDDDDQETNTRKHVLLERYFPAFLYVFFSPNETSGLPGRLALSGPVSSTSSSKFILQGVLRI